jgi:uncharacterized protein
LRKKLNETRPMHTLPLTTAITDNPADIDAAQWDALLAGHSSPSPFMRHAYLMALHASGSATPSTGWTPQFLTLHHGPMLIAACPLYRKAHSYGEYVFDWAWADAYQRHGLVYYPKLLGAVPFTPVPGPRLLARDAAAKTALLAQIQQLAQREGLSSIHLLFLDPDDLACARAAGWMLRSGVQFHWVNRSPLPYLDFPDFLQDLQREKRKKIQQERRKVGDAGVHFTVHEGAQIGAAEWDFFYRCYTQTYLEHRSTPYLSRDFFTRMASTMPTHWLLFIAEQNGQRIAASLIALDPSSRCAYGRYWGALAQVSNLHFEACYYQPLSWCIAHQYQRFEGGAQGEHKMARGLGPVQTWSAHWLAHPEFSQAIANFLARESEGVDGYLDELRERRPFK